jgi:hypothetical protein
MRFLIIFSLFCGFPVYSQLEGTYSHNYGLGHEAFEFHADGTFSCVFSHCTGRNVGSGHYTKRGRSLVLRFETDSTVVTEPTVKIDSVDSKNDSIAVNLNFKEYNEPLYGVDVFVVDSAGKQIIRVPADLEGNVAISFLPTQFPYKVYYHAFNKNFLMVIASRSAYTGQVVVPNRWVEHYKTGDVHRYTIRKAGKGAFDLKDNYPDASFVRFSVNGAGPP